MLNSLYTYLAERSIGGLLRDALDIAIVYYACYRALLVLRGTRAMQVGAGLVMLLALFAAARLLELATVTTILGTLFGSLLLVIVVVFQNDIRRGLQRIGSQAFLANLGRSYGNKVLELDWQTQAARRILIDRVGGDEALSAAARVEGITEREVTILLRRQARAGLYLDRMVACLLYTSDAADEED